MNDISLKLDVRTAVGKKAAKLHRDGIIPSVVYGGHADPISTQSSAVETTKVAHAAGKHTPVHLMIDGKKKLAIIKSIDVDPVKHLVRHVAFHTIKQNETITTEVPVILVGNGESAAERAGLVVLQAIEKLEVKAVPAKLPESIEMSIIDLTSTDDKLTVGDITLPEGVEFADAEQDMDLVIANVYEPSALQAANDAAGGDDDIDESSVDADNGTDTPQDVQAGESKQPNIGTNK
jgi:large subunit ribosomal protein L25